MFFQDFLDGNTVEEIAASETSDPSDLLGYARDGVQRNGKYYAISLLGCSNVLFYQKNDPSLANATAFNDVSNTLSQCT
ncbi:hypothetical protein [Breoghania sp.]|uniref:hypothetical protein n=1 Tax=Breoghania sp. TaxID=2065378 RepID=UPI002617383B|nr:hypothetical protein [Breoghania sp.]MDJ0932072.1 hypothetical protein [Breoghania sp.]